MEYLHTMVRVSDIEQSLDFYCNKLGLIEYSRKESEKGRFTLIFLCAPDDKDTAETKKKGLSVVVKKGIGKDGKPFFVIENPNFKEIPLEVTESDDQRSYHINSDKIKKKCQIIITWIISAYIIKC